MTGYTQRAFVAVTYKPVVTFSYGGMQLTITGLNGSSATLSIQGPTSFTTTITDGVINEDNLMPGTYTLVPSVSGPASPDQPTYTLFVPPGVRAPLTITYRTQVSNTGNMDITVTGLNGSTATATIIGPTGLSVVLTDGTQRVPNLLPGTYTLTPASSGTLTPQQPSYTVTINVNQNTPVTVTYVPGSGGGGCPGTCPPPCSTNCDLGNLTINVSGLATAATASSWLTGAYTTNIPLTNGTSNITKLPVGSYILNPYQTGDYFPTVPAIGFTISKDTTTTINVVYTYVPPTALPTGILTLQVIGLPTVTSVNVSVGGPVTINMNSQNTSTTVGKSDAPIGVYGVNAPSATNAQGTFIASPVINTRIFALSKGQRVDVIVDYRSTPVVQQLQPDRPVRDPDGCPYSAPYCSDNFPGEPLMPNVFHSPVDSPFDPSSNADGSARFVAPLPPRP